MADHDSAYKNIFSHAAMVADALRGFVREDWVGQLDFGTLERHNASFIAEDQRSRASDIVWRVRRQPGEWVYIYLMFEFQSSVDTHMALRMMVYAGLLYQDLLKTPDFKASGARLPAIFPVVIYNGDRPWTAATDVAALIEDMPPSLAAYRPSMRYCVLDEGRIPADELLGRPGNVFAELVRLETSRDPESVRQAVARLVKILAAPENSSLRRALTGWIRRLVLKRLNSSENVPEVNDLQEIEAMLAERVNQWTETWKQQGIEQGIKQGIEQGIAQGITKGRQEEALKLLQRLLIRRFGPLSAATLARLQGGTLDQFDQWADNILDATSVDEVFSVHPQ